MVDTVESGNELTLPYLSTSGFSRPILIPEPDGLGLSMPDDDFTLLDVPSSVGMFEISNFYELLRTFIVFIKLSEKKKK